MVTPTAFAITLEVAGVASIVLVAMSRRRGRTAGATLDVPERIQTALTGAGLPASVARVLATEAAVFYYALFAWRSKPFAPAGATNALLAVDALAAIWMLGFVRSVHLRPILVTGDSLLVRNGLVASIEIPRIQAAIEFGRLRVPARGTPGYFRAAMGQPNALVTVSTPVLVRRAYGRARPVDRFGLVLDDQKGFEAAWRRVAVDQPAPASPRVSHFGSACTTGSYHH